MFLQNKFNRGNFRKRGRCDQLASHLVPGLVRGIGEQPLSEDGDSVWREVSPRLATGTSQPLGRGRSPALPVGELKDILIIVMTHRDFSV